MSPELLPENWGGSVTTWVDDIVDFPKLSFLHFRMMVVTDSDLERIVSTVEDGEGRDDTHLLSLTLERCSGFSTDGLLAVTQNCREFGNNIKKMFLDDVGGDDDGLCELLLRCYRLEGLLIRGGNFTDTGLSTAVLQLNSLRYIWACEYSGNGDVDELVLLEGGEERRWENLLRMNRRHWNIKMILGEKFDEFGVAEDQINPSHFLSYYSLAGHKFDIPCEVELLNESYW